VRHQRRPPRTSTGGHGGQEGVSTTARGEDERRRANGEGREASPRSYTAETERDGD